ncbi:uncharacterized protein LOC110977828 [Acanthaster planci]|uniref:Uncharacterized protein LOC110977828 n=1 Tax=Acanthaster planci TaxID=133434 RepID=A0A8B7Y8A5_ACAPL|nr:uncharacterized protein LOC110977828 [Acanthaster planci]XP_022087987.1 uncharacterized protein LOC110977828 [Acanthaster planci]
MQHTWDLGDVHIEMTSPTASGPSTSNNHVNLKDFLSCTGYSLDRDHDRQAFHADISADSGQQVSGFTKSTVASPRGRSSLTNLMLPKMRRRPFQCKYCTFSCPSATNLSIHMRIHTGEKPYKCGTCSYASARKQNLFRHMSTVHKADRVTMCGPAQATSAYPIALQSSSEERMPVVESVYGGVQDVVLIDGDPVKIVGGDQGNFPTSDTASSSPHISQVYPRQSASSNSQQEDVIEIIPTTSSTPVTEYSTRHYADGSRFIFAGGVAATANSASTKIGAEQTSALDHQFDRTKETPQPQTQTGILNNEVHSVQVQRVVSPDESSVSKSEGPVQPPVYKEPITGALKRKQGRATSHSTLKNILDSPLMLPKRVSTSPTLVSSKSLEPLEKTSTEIKIIQSEEDLDEVLEGRRRMGIHVAPSGARRQQDFTPSPRSLNGGPMAESPFSYSRETPGIVYFPETNTSGGVKEVGAPSADAIPSAQASMVKQRHLSMTKPSLAQKVNEQRGKTDHEDSDDVVMVMDAPRRPFSAGNFSQRHFLQQAVENPSQLNTKSYSSAVNDKKDLPERYSFHNPNTFGRRHRTTTTLDIDREQKLRRNIPLKDSRASLARTALTIQVDLNKLLCCAARKWLKSHLVECDVCEINLPTEREESSFSSGTTRCSRGQSWAQENDDGYLRRARGATSDDQVGGMSSNIFSSRGLDIGAGSANQVHLGDAVATNTRKRQIWDGQDESGMLCSRQKQSCLSSRSEHLNFAKTAVISSSSAPISSTFIRSRTMDQPTECVDEPQESTEYIAFLNAELARGKSTAGRRGPKSKHICDICRKVCRSRAQLLGHRRTHIETSQLYRCAVCRYCTLHYKLLKRHIADKHPTGTKRSAFTECRICKKAIRVTAVASHVRTVHGRGLQVADGRSYNGGNADQVKLSGSLPIGAEDLCSTGAGRGGMQNSPPRDAVAMEADADAVQELAARVDTEEDAVTDGRDSVERDVVQMIKQEPPLDD